MLELSILGFLAEEPLHGYELKERITALTGHVRPVSDGALYPAITRLVTAGKLGRHTEDGVGAAPRQVLTLTAQGRADLLERLRRPKQAEITDHVRFNTVLAFLRHLPDPAEQRAVLQRRFDWLRCSKFLFFMRLLLLQLLRPIG
jgi:DNA-binding PadR family transcriptional regulator